MIQCAHCATPIPDDAKFCFACGSQVSDAEGQARASQSIDTEGLAHLEKLLREDTAGEFEIHRVLGRGGMAVVYLATEIHLSRKVAIKVLPPELTFGHGVDRFMREAKTAARLDHPNIIPIYRVSSGGKIFWYAMKYLEGRSLEEVLKERPRLPLEETIAILAQVAEALDYAHAHNVIHRDVKPANVMLDARNRVIVTDFGIAKALTERTLTASGSVVGTPYYMSPEQGMGRGVTGRSDQYSVAVMAYRMLSGQVPFEGDSAIDILHKHVMTPPPPLEMVAPFLPAHVCQAIHRALDKKPEARFPTVAALVEALRTPSAAEAPAALDPSSEAATVVVPSSQASLEAARAASLEAARAASLPTTQQPAQPTAPGTRSVAAAARPAARPQRSAPKAVLATLGLAALAGAGIGAWVLWQQRAARLAESAGGAVEGSSATSASGAGAEQAEVHQPPAREPARESVSPGPQTQLGGRAAAGTEPPAPGQEGTAAAPSRAGAAAAPGAAGPGAPSGQVAAAAGGGRAEREAKPAAPPPEPESGGAEAEPAELPSRPGMGLVVLRGLPRLYRLFVDGRPHLRPRAELSPGTHQIRVVSPGAPPFETAVTVVAGQRTVVRYGEAAGGAAPAGGGAAGATGAGPPAGPPAAGQLGVLQMRISPWAKVSINGVALGPKTLVVDTLIPGTHLLRFERDGFVTRDTTITLRAGEVVRLVIRMEPVK